MKIERPLYQMIAFRDYPAKAVLVGYADSLTMAFQFSSHIWDFLSLDEFSLVVVAEDGSMYREHDGDWSPFVWPKEEKR